MSPPNEQAGLPLDESPASGSLRRTNSLPDTTRRPGQKSPTQRERCRRLLERGWVCGVDFLNPADGLPPILRYTGRIHELRGEGWLIDRRECAHPWHNHGKGVQMWQWHIVGHVGDGTLPGIGGVS